MTATLRKAIDELETTLSRLGGVLDAVLFKAAWKGVASSLSLYLYNVVVAEAFFSQQASRQPRLRSQAKVLLQHLPTNVYHARLKITI